MTSDLIGINSNFGDSATISGSCGTTKAVCREYKGVNKGDGSSSKLDTTDSCLGAQGKLAKLPECGAEGSASASAVATVTSAKSTTLVTKTSTKITSSTKTSAAAEASATKEAAGSVARYGQCGGNGYTGATGCASGLTCKVQNEWYSQCL